MKGDGGSVATLFFVLSKMPQRPVCVSASESTPAHLLYMGLLCPISVPAQSLKRRAGQTTLHAQVGSSKLWEKQT